VYYGMESSIVLFPAVSTSLAPLRLIRGLVDKHRQARLGFRHLSWQKSCRRISPDNEANQHLNRHTMDRRVLDGSKAISP